MRKTKQRLTGIAVLLCLLLSACSGGTAENAEEEAVTAAAQTQEAIGTEAPVPDVPEDEQADPSDSAARFEMTLSDEERRYWENEYAEILNEYYEAITEDWAEYEYDSSWVNEYCMGETLDNIGYCFTDLDDDSLCELIVGFNDSQDNDLNGYLLSVYKLDNEGPLGVAYLARTGSAYDVSFDDGGRPDLTPIGDTAYFLCAENILKAKTEYFDGRYEYELWDLISNKCKLLKYVENYASEGYDGPWQYAEYGAGINIEDIDFNTISEKEAKEEIDAYDKLRGLHIDYWPLSEFNPDNIPIDDAGYLYESDADTWIVDDSGNITASKSNGDFDTVLAYGEGFYMLYRDRSGFDEAVHEVGIMKNDGTWPWEYGTIEDIPTDLVNRINIYSYEGLLKGFDDLTIEYIGNGTFVYYGSMHGLTHVELTSVYVVHCLDKIKYVIPNVVINYIAKNGRSFYATQITSEYAHLTQRVHGEYDEEDRMMILRTADGEIIADLGEGISSIGAYSDGGFVYMQESRYSEVNTSNDIATVATDGHVYTYQYDAQFDADGNYVSFGTWKCEDCGDVMDATEGNAVYYYELLENPDVSSSVAYIGEDNELLCFFDCATRESSILYLEDADKFAGCSYQFVDGEMEIRLTGADGETYYATVDKSGNYITEPHLNN